MRERTNKIQQFVIDNVEKNPRNIGTLVAKKFAISSQAANKHLSRLTSEGILEKFGKTRGREYKLADLINIAKAFRLSFPIAEDTVWRDHYSQALSKSLPENVYDICHYGFTEMLNNVIDHSGAKRVITKIKFNSKKITIIIIDSGIGIFKKIQTFFNLEDQRHAILELAKGKLTSDPDNHTGEGIFFTSRMFDLFNLRSNNISYIRLHEDDWLIEQFDKSQLGTSVYMEISIDSNIKIKTIFDKYAAGEEEYGFSRTHVPVELVRYEGEKLVSRSQAKRLLARFDKFKEVFLDFKGIATIGQAFADEIFRVFTQNNPSIKLVWTNTTPEIKMMIQRAHEHPSKSSKKQLSLFGPSSDTSDKS